MKVLKFGAIIILLWMFMVHLMPALIISSKFLLELSVKYATPFSYVQSINLPSYPDAKEMLEELNNRGYGEVVKKSGLRPIFITQGSLNKYFPRKNWLLGVAWTLPGYCYIIIDDTYHYSEIKSILWHEYIHCFGVDHSADRRDIMYPTNSRNMDINTIDNYLEYLKVLYE